MSLRGQRTGQAVSSVMDRYLVAVTGGVTVAFLADTVQGLFTRDEMSAGKVVTVQGQVYPAVDLAARLGQPSDVETPEMRTILLAQAGRRAAVRVARVQGLIELDRQHLVPLPKPFQGVEREWYAGLVLLAEGVATVLRTNWIVSDAGMSSGGAAAVPALVVGGGSC